MSAFAGSARSPLTRREIALLITLIAVSAAARLPSVFRAGPSYDEAVTLLEVSGHATPVWPEEPAPASIAKAQLRGAATLSQITDELRSTDVHPPLYYWCLTLWRQYLGFSIETARSLSVVFSLGTVVLFYLLLRAGGIKHPLIAVTIYTFSAAALHSATQARPYALASFLVMTEAFFAYRACSVLAQGKASAGAYSGAMAISFSAAFFTGYLTIFPGLVILLWYLFANWRTSRLAAVSFPLLALFLALNVSPLLFSQLPARPHQQAGFPGLLRALETLAQMNLGVIFPLFAHRAVNYALALATVALIATGAWSLWRVRKEDNRKLWLLLAGLVSAPTLGMLALNLLFNKHLNEPRYVQFAGPALAVFLSYPISRLASGLQMLAVAVIAVLQIAGTYSNEGGPDVRDLAREIETSSKPSYVVVLDVGSGRGHPASMVYELDPRTTIVSLCSDTDVERLVSEIQRFDDVWLVFWSDELTARVRDELPRRFLKSGSYRTLLQIRSATHFRKIGR
jgi:uncharacterized membrane protein